MAVSMTAVVPKRTAVLKAVFAASSAFVLSEAVVSALAYSYRLPLVPLSPARYFPRASLLVETVLANAVLDDRSVRLLYSLIAAFMPDKPFAWAAMV